MLILISGQPGNGKTLRALSMMREEYERNRAAHALGYAHEKYEEKRQFFANIEGITFDWVQPIPAAPERPDAPDWRLCPDGSYVVYDEAHADGNTVGLEHYGVLFPGTGKPGESQDPRVRAMSTSRHRGFDIVFITQWPSKVHHTIRQLVGRHVHMNRAMGMERAGVLTWSRVQPDPYDEQQREKAEEEIWVYPKDLYGAYQSATHHTVTHKFKLPKKVIGALSMLAAIPLVAWGLWSFVFKPDETKTAARIKPAAAIAQAPAGAGGPQASGNRVVYRTAQEYMDAMRPRIAAVPWSAPAYDGRPIVAEPVAYCIKSGEGLDGNGQHAKPRCGCLTEQGTRYEMPDATCRAVVDMGGVYNPFKEPERDQERSRREPGAGQRPAVEDAPASALAPVGMGTPGQLPAYGGFRREQHQAAPR